MTDNRYPNIKSLIYSVLEKSKLNNLKDCRKKFIVCALSCFASIKGKINFLQMERFSDKCEQYFRIHFENKINFQDFNLTMIKDKITECVVAFDPSFISKSGKCTYGIASYWSGCAKQTKRGLEICGFAAVDIAINTAFHLNAIQTLLLKNQTLLQYYCQNINENYLYFKELSHFLVADAYFSKKEVVDTVLSCGMHFISRLQKNAVLYYLNNEPPTGKKGRPKQFAGRVNQKEPDMNYFKLLLDTKELKIYNSIVYCKAFKRNINLSIAVFYKEKDGQRLELCRKMYFSTHLKQDGVKIVSYYRSRFQIEFLYRDAKQHCGLVDCQARSKNKLNFHFNAALTSVNLAKMHWLATRKSDSEPFSMHNFKMLSYNKLLLERFFRTFAINTKSAKNQQRFYELCEYGLIAA
jgi:hypothetical protein